MARNVSLLKLLTDLRAETRTSSNPAHNAGARDMQVQLLQRTQEWLYDEHDWAFLRVERYTDLQAGQRYYAPPSDMDIDRVERLDVRWGQDWLKLHYGIENSHLALYDSDLDVRSWPVTRWEIYEGEQIEMWPIPANDGDRYLNPSSTSIEGRLRFTGIRNLRPLVDDEDRADLDDRLIVLYAAAEMLQADGAKDAESKASAARARLKSIRGNMSKVKSFQLFGAGEPETEKRRPYIPSVHYRDRETG